MSASLVGSEMCIRDRFSFPVCDTCRATSRPTLGSVAGPRGASDRFASLPEDRSSKLRQAPGALARWN
eukprot:3422337-Alexandrium_andersonii.AAC.1